MAGQERDIILLFPAYLNLGSRGAAVIALQVFIIMSRLCSVNDCNSLITGVYDNETAEAVRQLQIHIGLVGNDVDGNFGQVTRRKLKGIIGFDLDSWRRSSTSLKTFAVQPDGSTIEW